MTTAARAERQANAKRHAAEGARRVVAAAKVAARPPPELTDAERAAYTDTEVCRRFNLEPQRWLRDAEGRLVLRFGPRAAAKVAP